MKVSLERTGIGAAVALELSNGFTIRLELGAKSRAQAAAVLGKIINAKSKSVPKLGSAPANPRPDKTKRGGGRKSKAQLGPLIQGKSAQVRSSPLKSAGDRAAAKPAMPKRKPEPALFS